MNLNVERILNARAIVAACMKYMQNGKSPYRESKDRDLIAKKCNEG